MHASAGSNAPHLHSFYARMALFAATNRRVLCAVYSRSQSWSPVGERLFDACLQHPPGLVSGGFIFGVAKLLFAFVPLKAMRARRAALGVTACSR